MCGFFGTQKSLITRAGAYCEHMRLKQYRQEHVLAFNQLAPHTVINQCLCMLLGWRCSQADSAHANSQVDKTRTAQNVLSHMRSHTHTHTHTHTHAHTHIHARTHMHTLSRTRAHIRTHRWYERASPLKSGFPLADLLRTVRVSR